MTITKKNAGLIQILLFQIVNWPRPASASICQQKCRNNLEPLELHTIHTGHNEDQHLEDSNQNERCFRPWIPATKSINGTSKLNKLRECAKAEAGPHHIHRIFTPLSRHMVVSESFHSQLPNSFQSTEFAPPNRLCAHVPGASGD